jgi:hypothetical protein
MANWWERAGVAAEDLARTDAAIAAIWPGTAGV